MHALRRAYRAAFFGQGNFRERVDSLASGYGEDPLVARMVEFIRSGARPLTMAAQRADGAEAL
jgi:UDP-N-acetylglucosamine acyltransferase